ncbi:DUF2971 domain-containing protein [Tenacibaculum sp. nBUS_03]|uniref:DUF2971 domain-containing protein n=1 Tax=Tenacibaculum sp. nBUS_03 TaxID=3395320 RepID=UPI003EB698CD
MNNIIYKYRDWEDVYHKKVLKENSLFLASPKSFNDPFDCKIPDNILSIDTDEKKEKYITNFIKSVKSLGEDKTNDFTNKLRDTLTNDLSGFHKRLELAKYKSNDEKYGVISFSEKWDNVLMWSHYARNHKGFSVGYYKDKIISSKIFSITGKVNYDQNHKFPNIDPLLGIWDKAIINCLSKSKDWEYEQEYRALKNFCPLIPKVKDRIIKIPDDYIAEIILGYDICEEHESEIKEIAKNRNIPIYKITKVPGLFKLDRQVL